MAFADEQKIQIGIIFDWACRKLRYLLQEFLLWKGFSKRQLSVVGYDGSVQISHGWFYAMITRRKWNGENGVDGLCLWLVLCRFHWILCRKLQSLSARENYNQSKSPQVIYWCSAPKCIHLYTLFYNTVLLQSIQIYVPSSQQHPLSSQPANLAIRQSASLA